MTKRLAFSNSRALLAGGALLAAFLATAGSAGPARSMLMPEDIAGLSAPPVKASLRLPSSGPISRAGHLADQRGKAYLMSASASGKIVAPRDVAPSRSGQVAWLTALLASMCGLILLVGRQLPEGLAVPHNGSRRRA